MVGAPSRRSRSWRAGWCAALALGLVAWGAGGGAVGAAAAHASRTLTTAQIRHALNPGPHVHAMPTRSLAQRIHASVNPNTIGNLAYHGGPVMRANYSIPIFWMPSTLQSGASAAPSASFESIVSRYFADIGGSGLYGLTTQYFQTVNGPTEFITNTSGQIQAIIDTRPYPTAGSGCGATNGPDCVDDAQLHVEIAEVILDHPAFTKDLSTEYYVFLAPHESECVVSNACFDSDTDPTPANFEYCAYHGWFNMDGVPVMFATMPYGADALGDECTALATFPNDNDADIEVSTTSLEQMETTTAPDISGGWYSDDNGAEMGDECTYNYGPTSLDNGLANVRINGHYYVVQQEWSNAVSGCSLGTMSSHPINDNFAFASALPPQGGTVDGSNTTATKQANEPKNAANAGGKSVWWSWTPSGSGTVTVDTCTAAFDTTIGVYTGAAVNKLTAAASNNDSSACGAGSHQSSATFFASYGTRYWISVDGFNKGGGASNGSIVLHASNMTGAVPSAPTVNDANAGDGWVNVTWSPPTSNGDTPIGSYIVVVGSKAVVVPATARRAVVTGLDDLVQVNAAVYAVNLGGVGEKSNTLAVTPAHAFVDVRNVYDAAGNTRLLKNATYFGTDAADAQRDSVGALAFIAGLVHAPAITPTAVPLLSTGITSYLTSWAPADQGALVTVMRQYALTPEEAQYFCVQLVGYLLALGGH